MRLVIASFLSLLSFALCGCSSGPMTQAGLPVAQTHAETGVVMAGGHPVANSVVQLYSVGVSGDGSAAFPLLGQAVFTNSLGEFDLSGLYSCSNAGDVYLTAMGGNAVPGSSNANLGLMVAIGPCQSLSATTPIVLNELTTVAATSALTRFMDSPTSLGSATDDTAQLNAAFTFAAQLVNIATGASPGQNPPSGDAVPVAELNTLGDIMSACTDSAGGSAGDGTPCGKFFNLATPTGSQPPTNTIQAALYVEENPDLNTSELFQMTTAAAPYEPQLSSAPANFGISFTAPLTVTPTVSLSLSPSSLSFTAIPLGSTSQVQETTLSNTGNVPVPISSMLLAGNGAPDFTQTNSCPQSLPVGGACTIQISFTPQGTTATSATLTVNSGQAVLTISGTGSDSDPGVGNSATSGGGSTPAKWPSALLAAQPSLYLNFNETSANFTDQISGLSFVTGGGSVTPGQPGFDADTVSNTAAAFAWNAYNQAPNTVLGAIEWDSPWTMLIHIDRLNWTRTGTLVLASKGDFASNTWWKLTLGMAGPGYSQLCFTRSGAGKTGSTQNGFCSGWLDAMPNGFNYDIVIEDNGTGEVGMEGSGATSALSMYINGLPVIPGGGPIIAGGPTDNSYSSGFGYVNLSVTGGTGYADTTAFTSMGGGPNCVVSGFMYASGGVPYNGNWSPTGSSNYGCTSAPSIVLTSPTGTGAMITATPSNASMNSTGYPLMVPGYVSNGKPYGVAGSNYAENPINIDEFAVFPGNLTFSQVSQIFAQTVFYQGLIKKMPSPDPLFVFDDDGCADLDNEFTLQMLIALHKKGIVTLSGVVAEDGSVTCEALWRQMMNQASLQSVPMTVPNAFWANSGELEPATNIAAYDPSTPLSNAAWGSSTAMYRTLLAQHPSTPINIILGGPYTALAEFMVSPADGISPLSGLQLLAQNAANGGVIYAQGFGCNPSAPPDTTPCSLTTGPLQDVASSQFVLANHGTTPIYWLGGTPQSAGPGELSTRTAPDPMFLFERTVGADQRQCYDCLMVEAAVSDYFFGGVQVGYSGGTGYAAATPFTFSGGGSGCQGTGFLTANNGVPNGIEFQWGNNIAGFASGIGSGCTSAPTVNLVGATGGGVKLTAYPTSVCGTMTATSKSTSVSSATCNNEYFEPYTAFANQSPVSGAVMTWFINSLVDLAP